MINEFHKAVYSDKCAFSAEKCAIIAAMKYFFTHRDHIPQGMGYGQFSPAHLIWIALTTVFIVAVAFFYSGAALADKLTILRSIAVALMISEVIKLVLMAATGVKVSEYLPLEICSFGAYFIVLDSISASNPFYGVMLLTLFMPGAIMAIVFPTTQSLPAVNFYTIHQFLYHGLIVAYVAARFVCGEIPLAYPALWGAIARILVLIGIMYVVDTVFDKNFMFLRDAYENPMLEIIRKYCGDGPRYTIGLILFSIFVINVFFCIFKLITILFHI